MKEKIARLEAEKAAKKASSKIEKVTATSKHRSSQKDPVTSYYKNFNKKPIDFRAMYETSDDDKYSSSNESASDSSDDFPSPESPQRRRKNYRREEDHTELFDKVRELQRRMYEMELKNKRREAEHGGRKR